ncbi:hypothetical protein [Pseudomonas japonica]|uniref:hypothetical protein n=1 Tax=Pseudomonas japonica TaxID=256466 RepID=UPI003A891064
MPTENRSSNTEIPNQHPQGRRERFQKWVLSTKHPVLGYLDGTWLARGDDREGYADKYVQGLWVAFKQFDQPAPQPNPEPIAWMVGTAFWWTKEEAERDAADTGLPIVGLGPMTCAAPAEQHHGEPVALKCWSCKAEFTLKDRSDCDGCCWKCGVEIELDMYSYHTEWIEPVQLAKVNPSYDRGFLEGCAESKRLNSHAEPGEVERLRSMFDQTNADLRASYAKLAERDALLDGLDEAWNSHDGKERFGELMKQVESLSHQDRDGEKP